VDWRKIGREVTVAHFESDRFKKDWRMGHEPEKAERGLFEIDLLTAHEP